MPKTELLHILYSVECAVKSHYHMLNSAIQSQRLIIDRMWLLAQRYTMMMRGVPFKRTCPIEASHRIEDEIRTEFHIKLAILDDSNSKLTSSLSDVKATFYALREYMAGKDILLELLDTSETIQPPITYFIELFTDFLKFFAQTQSKLNCFAILLTSDNVASLERYKTLLEPNTEFQEYFLKSLAYCSCLSNTQNKANT